MYRSSQGKPYYFQLSVRFPLYISIRLIRELAWTPYKSRLKTLFLDRSIELVNDDIF